MTTFCVCRVFFKSCQPYVATTVDNLWRYNSETELYDIQCDARTVKKFMKDSKSSTIRMRTGSDADGKDVLTRVVVVGICGTEEESEAILQRHRRLHQRENNRVIMRKNAGYTPNVIVRTPINRKRFSKVIAKPLARGKAQTKKLLTKLQEESKRSVTEDIAQTMMGMVTETGQHCDRENDDSIIPGSSKSINGTGGSIVDVSGTENEIASNDVEEQMEIMDHTSTPAKKTKTSDDIPVYTADGLLLMDTEYKETLSDEEFSLDDLREILEHDDSESHEFANMKSPATTPDDTPEPALPLSPVRSISPTPQPTDNDEEQHKKVSKPVVIEHVSPSGEIYLKNKKSQPLSICTTPMERRPRKTRVIKSKTTACEVADGSDVTSVGGNHVTKLELGGITSSLTYEQLKDLMQSVVKSELDKREARADKKYRKLMQELQLVQERLQRIIPDQEANGSALKIDEVPDEHGNIVVRNLTLNFEKYILATIAKKVAKRIRVLAEATWTNAERCQRRVGSAGGSTLLTVSDDEMRALIEICVDMQSRNQIQNGDRDWLEINFKPELMRKFTNDRYTAAENNKERMKERRKNRAQNKQTVSKIKLTETLSSDDVSADKSS